MRLESDPTVIYGLEDFDGNLTRRHLKTPTALQYLRKIGIASRSHLQPGKSSHPQHALSCGSELSLFCGSRRWQQPVFLELEKSQQSRETLPEKSSMKLCVSWRIDTVGTPSITGTNSMLASGNSPDNGPQKRKRPRLRRLGTQLTPVLVTMIKGSGSARGYPTGPLSAIN